MIPPGILKSSQPIGDESNLRMALDLTYNFVRYSYIYIYTYIGFNTIAVFSLLSLSLSPSTLLAEPGRGKERQELVGVKVGAKGGSSTISFG